jgi:GNAT superfamily N-acetyltransferase
VQPKRLEEVSLNAWPALQHMLLDGWLLRFAKGYTRRANSINPLYGSSMNIDAKIDTCEATYAQKGLPVVFRLTPFATPADLDHNLACRHYERVDLTHVQHVDLTHQELPGAAAVTLQEESLDHWMDIFCHLRDAPITNHQTHKEILQAIPSRRFLASLQASDRIVACGVGVLELPYFGLFDLITASSQRNKGYGTKLVSGLLHWAQEHGATDAYLQVVGHNAPARHLYTKLGFRDIYQYWYRILRITAA